jgi:3-deoxy-manno-octulosonate cytidylyltransferase (CMP-KDO synthetase)
LSTNFTIDPKLRQRLLVKAKGKVILGIVPARIGSDEVYAKVLQDIGGKPVIQHVWEKVKQAEIFTHVLVGADHEKITTTAEKFGAKTVLTKLKHICGSDRCAEVYQSSGIKADIVVNIQADEPFLNPNMLYEVIEPLLDDKQWDMSTLCCKFLNEEAAANIFNVKVVKSQKSNRALYFSRSLIPYPKNPGSLPTYHHIGVYAFHADALLKFAKFGPSSLELRESLEQLRALENDININVVESSQEYRRIAINTAKDIEDARKALQK